MMDIHLLTSYFKVIMTSLEKASADGGWLFLFNETEQKKRL